MVMTFQTHQFRREQRQAKRTGADKRQVRMRQTATIARQDDAPASNQVGEGERSGTEDALLRSVRR
ncbi:Uncharacterised protein [Salmonella enterica subsp. enterica]|nr:Uncharacterised protein [Salmonella enterica subsp. enterica] [Salmonella enterica subsp. enterica serovar Menston]